MVGDLYIVTENLFPFVADGIVDGGLAADAAPSDLRAAVEVLRAAGQSGSVEELATMATLVQQFTAGVTTAASSMATEMAASANPAVSHDSPRSPAMFSTRITRRALSIVAITLLAAGTAAAAAGGALPMFEDDATEVVVDNGDINDVTSIEAGTHESDTTQSSDDEADDEASDSSVADTVPNNNNGTVDHHGKCTAWTNGSAKDASNPAFAELQVAADAAGVTIDEYCATVLGTHSNDDATTDDDADDKPADDGSGGESGDNGANNGNHDGNDNGGGGNSGNSGGGNGNSGNGNGNDVESED